jgi:glycerophosphoryl diester phosphodiesterase
MKVVAIVIAALVAIFYVLAIRDRNVVVPQGTSENASAIVLREEVRSFAKGLIKDFMVIGHRGNSSEAPENTLAAINEAFGVGAGMVEVDIHLSRDGVPVVVHDESVDRTTNGKGLVAQLTLAELKTLDAGFWKSPKYAGEKIPTLGEVLLAAKGKGLILLDLKVDNMAAAIARVFDSLGLPQNLVMVATQTAAQCEDFRTHLPGSLILYNFEAPDTWETDFFKKELARGIDGIELGANWSPQFVSEAHQHGMPVFAYTINDDSTLRQLIGMGINGIETDIPRVMRQAANEALSHRAK